MHLRTAIPGPRSQELRDREDAHVAPGLQGYAVMSGVAIESGAGSVLVDVDGNELLDLIGGIGVGALGHSHPSVVQAIRDQVARVSVGSFTSRARVELVEHVARRAPSPELHRLQLYTSGAEAVESALRLARSHTGKHEVVSFWGGFHGKTLGAMSLLGGAAKAGFGPTAGGTHQIPYADCYRCPLKLAHPQCGLACVELGRKQLRAQSSGSIAAFIVEPMQGTAGNVVPPDDFLVAVKELAREHDALFIADEMITGFGRTGRYWGVDHAGVRPDIVTLGKAFGGGFPLSGLLTTEQDYPFVGHVRGRGLFLGLELVANRHTREPLSRAQAEWIFHECLRRGLLTMAYSPSFRIQPALTLDRDTAGNAIAILREVFDAVKLRNDWRTP